MCTSYVRGLFFCALMGALFLAGCNNRSRGGRLPFPDASSDSGAMGDSSPFDSGRADSSTMDSSRPPDTSVPRDTRPPPPPDTSTPRDTSTPPDTSLPGDSGLPPLGDAGICIPGILECPAGQVCCDLGGFGMCMVTCT